MEEKDLLKFAISTGIIDFGVIQKEYDMNEKKKYLEQHNHEIWQGKNGNWYTYLPDKEKGRVLKKRTSEKAIKDIVISFYKENSDEEERKRKEEEKEQELNRITLKLLYPKWLKYKCSHTNSTSYIKRITADWIKFYLSNEKLINIPIRELNKLYLDEWIHNTIKNMNLTKKSYYNMSLIIRQCLDYAVELGIIEQNIFSEIKVNTKMFTRTKKKISSTQVYNEFEEEKLINDMFRRFSTNPKSTAPLAVVLAFELGVRIGEMCALKFSDIDGNYISIQRQEVRDFEFIENNENFAMRFKEFKIVEYTKTEDGYRDIFLTKNAKELIEIIKEINIHNGEPNNSYIFIKDSKNINHYSIQAMIKRGCEHIDILIKTSHKIRKTYVSKLIDSGLNIDEIRRMVGHADERTTLGCYCFNRLTDLQTEDKIENALKTKKVIGGNHKILDYLK